MERRGALLKSGTARGARLKPAAAKESTVSRKFSPYTFSIERQRNARAF